MKAAQFRKPKRRIVIVNTTILYSNVSSKLLLRCFTRLLRLSIKAESHTSDIKRTQTLTISMLLHEINEEKWHRRSAEYVHLNRKLNVTTEGYRFKILGLFAW